MVQQVNAVHDHRCYQNEIDVAHGQWIGLLNHPCQHCSVYKQLKILKQKLILLLWTSQYFFQLNFIQTFHFDLTVTYRSDNSTSHNYKLEIKRTKSRVHFPTLPKVIDKTVTRSINVKVCNRCLAGFQVHPHCQNQCVDPTANCQLQHIVHDEIRHFVTLVYANCITREYYNGT